MLMMEKRRKDTADARQLNELFAKLGVDDESGISVADFERCVQNRDLEAFLNARGIDIKDAKTFFTMLSESMGATDQVDIGTVVGSCLRIKGLATSIDLHILRYEVRMLQQKQALFIESVEWLQEEVLER